MTNNNCARRRNTPSSRFEPLEVDVVRDDPDETVISDPGNWTGRVPQLARMFTGSRGQR
ncbi:hypothetical protein [Pseudonocardia charpentierae]|uniref:DUF397 domain-containing protein n=1 Tax=Pseudonocardia charpentierae TaxID=3075545 RepID=A0ABU2NCG5_9PSEU|nr:hypothetical protein [Pseudonocardia sp. DSM 45834]MDT0351648.1 hypothetical protein [Pseudonocardia sp. DSM 45834]